MARKKFYTQHDTQVLEDNKNRWKTAVYIRLSREDGDKRESDSIVNQKKLLNYYIEQHEEFLSATTFVDENYTGTNFNRPGFQRMLKKIKEGHINCIIIKDLSRFGRSYLQAGNYLENVFPKYNVRFISVIDGIDTYANPESVNDIMVWIKNMMHEYNSQRISVNVRATKTAQQKVGKYIAPLAPYGYMKEPLNKHKLIVDEEVRPIIENIYKWYLSGMGDIRITKKLNDMGISSRKVYRQTGSIFTDSKTASVSNWKPAAITQILTNKVYMGAVVGHKTTTRNYKDRREIQVDDKDHIVALGMHEPIVSVEQFELVQNKRQRYCTKTSRNEDKVYVLSGLLRCKDCGYAMIRNPKFAKGKLYVYYKCRAYNQRGTAICTHNHSMREEQIISATLAALNIQIETLIDIKCLIYKINAENKQKTAKNSINFDKMIAEKRRNIITAENNKIDSYSDWKDELISKEDFILFRDRYDETIKKINDEVIALVEEKELQDTLLNNQFDWLDSLIEHGRITELTREIASTFIDTIHIDKDKNLTIDFKFKNEFETLLRVMSNMGYLEQKEVCYV